MAFPHHVMVTEYYLLLLFLREFLICSTTCTVHVDALLKKIVRPSSNVWILWCSLQVLGCLKLCKTDLLNCVKPSNHVYVHVSWCIFMPCGRQKYAQPLYVIDTCKSTK